MSNCSDISISVVIPTRNRPKSLERCLVSLIGQTFPLHEIIVVDASDEPIDEQRLRMTIGGVRTTFLREGPSVCKQRNRGIRAAGGTHILLSDDDIEFPIDYVATIMDFMKSDPDVPAISGMLLEPTSHGFESIDKRPMSLPALVWRSLFQLTVWGDVDSTSTSFLAAIPLRWLKEYYRKKGNTFTLAGWPVVTQIGGENFRVATYGLGAAIVRRDLLIAIPFDESLDPHGIGDNYWIAINLPGELPITILRTTVAYHHRADQNRLEVTTTYYRRILALHYFMKRSARFTMFNRVMLLWSLIGNFIPELLHFDFIRSFATAKAAFVISVGRNPYVLAQRRGINAPVTPRF